MTDFFHELASPVGNLILVAHDEMLCGLYFSHAWQKISAQFPGAVEAKVSVHETAEVQLAEYFAGKRKRFALPLLLRGTPFQKEVWSFLAGVPYGITSSYKQQAMGLGNPKAVRAVGRANGLNPLSIVLPCHRVIGSDGALTGYAGGLENKRFLLNLEARFSLPI